MKVNHNFSGYATKAGLKCKDGRVIDPLAFKHNDGVQVPLVWQHLHSDPNNVLGHAQLSWRNDGMYAYCYFNESPAGKQAKLLVEHNDIKSLSIYANDLLEESKLVKHGNIREVSLVFAGANPGALIDYINISHGDGSIMQSDDEAIITTGLEFTVEKSVSHADEEDETMDENTTVGDVVESMTPEQKKVLYFLVAQVAENNNDDEKSAAQSAINKGDSVMKNNVFSSNESNSNDPRQSLTHDQLGQIFQDAVKLGSLKASVLQHAVTYGIENIDYLFPDAKTLTPTPTFIERDRGWVNVWMSFARKNPFSRIKTVFADITEANARALGYIKGALKKEEFFALSKRVTTPTTIYKKQQLDRDDIIDIVDLDVVAFVKQEMRFMLDEEIARACLIGDGRAVDSPDKINETNIRPIYSDSSLFTIRKSVASNMDVMDMMEELIRARKTYKGVGNPVMFTTTDFLTEMFLLKDTLNRRLYPTMNELKAALRVSDIVEVPVMEGVSRTDTTPDPDVIYDLKAILLNPNDYVMGADKGGAIAMFDDFDIDYNQYKYLMETRMSGCLVKPYTAIVLEQARA